MKALVFLMSFFSLAHASAAVYSCSEDKGKGEYLLALKDDSGIVYSQKEGFFQPLDGVVQVVRASDGGPTHVSVAPTKVIDWKKKQACFVTVGTRYNFTISVGSRGDRGSMLMVSPNIITRPNVMCRLPTALTPPRGITCELL
ncbi:MAG: hypothetical protein KDD25_02425 [Bdellovibrionales bacterium]|nr:hypothetical protein [Bdellovibrionales bacterium]